MCILAAIIFFFQTLHQFISLVYRSYFKVYPIKPGVACVYFFRKHLSRYPKSATALSEFSQHIATEPKIRKKFQELLCLISQKNLNAILDTNTINPIKQPPGFK